LIVVVFALLASVGFGTSAIFIKLGLNSMKSTTGTFLSLVSGSLILITISLIFYSKELVIANKTVFSWLILSALLNFLGGRYLNYTSVNLLGVARATTIIGTAPLFATVLAITIGNETLTLPVLLGTLMIIFGLLMVISEK
tara:strand:+ start:333 stop:755 length:423 start_codon:yes stop_codon:yes gene_type:complete